VKQLFTATDRRTMRHFMKVTISFRTEFLLSLLNPVGAILIYSVLAYFIGKTLAVLATSSGNPREFLPYLLGVALLGSLCNWFGFRSMIRLQAKGMGYLQSEALYTLLKRGVGFHNNNLSGKLVSDAIDYPVAYSMINAAVFMTIIPFVCIIVSGVIIVFVNNWVLGLIVFTMSCWAVGSALIESRRRSGLRTIRLKAQKKLIGHLADTITNAATVKAFANESAEMKTHQGYNHKLLGYRLDDWSRVANTGGRRIAILLLFQIGLVIAGIELVSRDPSLLAASIFAFTYSITLVNRLFTINEMIRGIEDGLLQASPMTDIIDESIEISDAPGATTLTVLNGSVDLQNISFKYDDSKHQDHVFENLNFTINPKQKVGLIGASGSGKSTLARLLLRFEDIQSGGICIDGQNIANVTQDSLRQAIAYVPQEPLLFHRSIIDNIAYGNPDASLGQIERAAEQAFASQFIARLPQGMDTIVGERGVKLSGGQRQRIAIARAILKDAPILVLDEATSALDSESEHLIQQALVTLMQNRTVIVIAHRLSTIAHLDRILVMEDGKLIQDGPHQTLLNQTGMYQKLWQRQSGGFIED